jgi:hypothetical protein
LSHTSTDLARHPQTPTLIRLTQAQQEAVDVYLKNLDKWTSGEATIQKGLSEALPPALYLAVQKEMTVKNIWDAVVKHHQQKAQLIIIELCQKFQNKKCKEKGDVCAHLSKLSQMQKDLALMGEVVTDDNYQSIILSSLPTSHNMFLTSITNQISPLSYQMKLEVTMISGIAFLKWEVTITPLRISPDDLIEIIG